MFLSRRNGVDVLGMVLAGGRGRRLYPLTRDRAKPAVAFGGKFRIIDFVLSNLVNSEIYSIYVLTQFKAQSLIEHIRQAWPFPHSEDQFVTSVPAQMQKGSDWYRGTADALYQNIHLIKRANPSLIAVFSADHIYKMDIRQMVDYHRRLDAEVTVAAVPAPIDKVSQFGAVDVDDNWMILRICEEPAKAKRFLGNLDQALVSMGNYLFETDLLIACLEEDSVDAQSSHNFGRDILPRLVQNKRKIYAYDFRNNRILTTLKSEEMSYWRDIGNIEAYYEANMDLCAVNSSLDLYNRSWPIRTAGYDDPPCKFVFDENGRTGRAVDSIVGEGTIISGSLVRDSVIGTNVRIHSYSLIEKSVIMSRVEIGRGCRIRRIIIDKNVYIPPGTEIGYDLEKDRERHFVSDTGIVVIPREEPSRPWSMS